MSKTELILSVAQGFFYNFDSLSLGCISSFLRTVNWNLWPDCGKSVSPSESVGVYLMYFKALFFRCFNIHYYGFLINWPLCDYEFSYFSSLTLFWNALSYLCSHFDEYDTSFSIILLLLGQNLKSSDLFLPSSPSPNPLSFFFNLDLKDKLTCPPLAQRV